MEHIGLLDLSDEVLVLIFEYATAEDKLNLYATCKRLNHILRDKRLIRTLSFEGCYTTNISRLKYYLRPKMCRENIKELNLTSCYWLTSMDIRDCVVKLSNLQALYVVDTSLSENHLKQILCALSQLKRLSWTWSPIKTVCTASLCPQLHNLEFLFLYIKTEAIDQHNFVQLCTWLSLCNNLQELWIIVPSQERYMDTVGQLPFDIPFKFPHMHTLVISLMVHTHLGHFLNFLFSRIIEGCRSNDSWQCYWVSKELGKASRCSPCLSEVTTLHMNNIDRGVVPDICKKLQHLAVVPAGSCMKELGLGNRALKKLLWNPSAFGVKLKWNLLWELVTDLEELNVRTCVENVVHVCPQKNLRKLALPMCTLIGDDAIEVVVETCPNIEEFELIQCSYCYYLPGCKKQESTLAQLAKWKYLRRLKLHGLDFVRSGNPFVQIFKSCENLEGISLKNLGLRGHCTYLFELCKALKCCKNLKDFRIEQPNMSTVDSLFRTLQSCPLIERVCIISSPLEKQITDSALLDFVKGAPKLVFLYVALGSLTLASCSHLSKNISKWYKNSRPALCVAFLGNRTRYCNVKILPGIHYFEMLEDVSRICTKPGNGNRYLSHA